MATMHLRFCSRSLDEPHHHYGLWVVIDFAFMGLLPHSYLTQYLGCGIHRFSYRLSVAIGILHTANFSCCLGSYAQLEEGSGNFYDFFYYLDLQLVAGIINL